MADNIFGKINCNSVKSAVIPIECLSRLKSDIIRFRETEKLNGFQEWITHEGYVLDVPELPFEPKSILIITAQSQLVHLNFRFGEKHISDVFAFDRKDLRDSVEALLSQNGYHGQGFFWLPQKRLAVCAGLAEYGRNNIVYTDAWGSYFEILTYITDMPCSEAYTWREVKCMDSCGNCKACLSHCPTNAIKDDTYLIDNTSCLTLFTESEKPFPDWLPKEVHHSVIGCFRCQEICPKNNGRLDGITDTVEFDEGESALLLAGADKGTMPQSLLDKIDALGFDEWRLKSFPKNFEVLLDR